MSLHLTAICLSYHLLDVVESRTNVHLLSKNWGAGQFSSPYKHRWRTFIGNSCVVSQATTATLTRKPQKSYSIISSIGVIHFGSLYLIWFLARGFSDGASQDTVQLIGLRFASSGWQKQRGLQLWGEKGREAVISFYPSHGRKLLTNQKWHNSKLEF